MPRVQIVTDAAVRFTERRFPHEHQITIVPVQAYAPERMIEDSPGVELAGLGDLFANGSRPMRASAASVEEIAAVYADIHRQTDQIISIHTSATLLDAHPHALRASQQFLGRCDIQVIDSQSVSVGLGLLCQAAVLGAEQGMEFDELVRVVRGMIPRLYVVFFLDDVTFLERQGLISRSQAILGNMLGVIPFLTMEDGKMIPMEKVRTRPRALEKIIEFVSEFSNAEHLSILQSSSVDHEETRLIMERLRAAYPDTPISLCSYGPTLATKIGSHAMGIVVLEAEEEASG
jgi:DegV family protein with EDD domain